MAKYQSHSEGNHNQSQSTNINKTKTKKHKKSKKEKVFSGGFLFITLIIAIVIFFVAYVTGVEIAPNLSI